MKVVTGFLCPLQGPGHVPVRQDEDLLQGRTGGVPGEAPGGQISVCLHQDPKDCAWLATESSVPKDPSVCHPSAKIWERIPGTQVTRTISLSVFSLAEQIWVTCICCYLLV